MIGRILRPIRSGAGHSPLNRSGLRAPDTIRLTSPSFADGTAMPIRHAGRGVGEDISPALRWSEISSGAMGLLLILDDIDVPLPFPLMHSVAVLDPTRAGLAEGEFVDGTVRVVPTLLSKHGYSGPRPIPGHGPHRYRFHLLALDRAVPEDARTVKAVLAAADGHVLARGTLTGTFER